MGPGMRISGVAVYVPAFGSQSLKPTIEPSPAVPLLAEVLIYTSAVPVGPVFISKDYINCPKPERTE